MFPIGTYLHSCVEVYRRKELEEKQTNFRHIRVRVRLPSRQGRYRWRLLRPLSALLCP